jgi:hypothetical protein
MKIYADKENSLSNTLRQTFSDKNEMHFVPKEYFDTLNPQEKAGYIRTQKEYQTAYRTLIVHGVKT